MKRFCCLIVDEAGQSTEADFFIPISRFNLTKVIVVGDPKQLPPTVLSKEAKEHHFGTSFMERVIKEQSAAKTVVQLEIQSRMHPVICRFPSRAFYDG